MVDADGRRRDVHRQSGHRHPAPDGDRRQSRAGRGRRVRRGQPGPLRRRHPRPARSSSVELGRQADRRSAAGPAAAPTACRGRTAAPSPASTDAQLAGAGRAGRPGAGALRSTRRTPSGRIDADGTVWLTQARPITTLYPVPASRRCRRPRLFLCAEPGSGPDPADHPDGPGRVPADRHRRSPRVAGHPPDRPRTPDPSGFAVAGQRLFVDITPILRHPPGPPGRSGVAGVMEARTKAVLAAARRRPALRSPTSRLTGRPCRSWPGGRAPGQGAAPRWLTRAGQPKRSRPPRVARIERATPRPLTHARRTRPRTSGSTAVEERLGTDTFLMMPRAFAYAAAGLLLLAARPAAARRPRRGPSELQTVLRGLPHNVTTEMDLELWRLTSRIARRSGRRPRRSPPSRRRTLAEAYRGGTLPAGRPARTRRLPAPRTGTGPSPRSTSACRAGRATRATCSA